MDVKPARSRWITQFPILVAVSAAIIMLVLTPFWAVRWYRTPFLGMLLEPNNVVNTIDGDNWPALEQGVKFKDRLVALGGNTVSSADQVANILTQNGYRPIQASFVNAAGEQFTLEITPIKFPFTEILSP